MVSFSPIALDKVEQNDNNTYSHLVLEKICSSMHISISISKSIGSNAMIFFLGDINILKIFCVRLSMIS